MKQIVCLAGSIWGMVFITVAYAAEMGRYQAVPLESEGNARGGNRVFIIDTQEGHVWTWSGNELVSSGGNERRYGPAFIYHGKVRPGSRTGEFIELLPK